MSFGLVLLATILLVVGLLADDGLTLIYISIAASFTAAVVLYVAFRRARPEPDTDREAPTPIPPEGAEPEPRAEEPTTVTPAVPSATTTPEAVVAAAEEPAEAAPVLTSDPAASADDDWTSDEDWAADGEFEVEFPIADYDDLTVAEIMPLLPQLYSDELGVVAERERKGKNRSTILSRLDELAATGTEADALEGATLGSEASAPEAAAPASEPTRSEAAATPRPAAAAPQVPSLSDDEGEAAFVFPIADYDELSVDQIVPLLAQLEDDELQDVKAREAAGQGRRSVIAEIDRQLGLVDADATPGRDDDGWAQAPEPVDAPDARPEPEEESAESSVLAISGYDGLTVAQIRPLLSGLSHQELRAVLDHEVARDNRRTIVNEIERRLDAPDEAAAPAKAKAATRAAAAPARKSSAKKATAKKATTKRRAAKKSTRSKKATTKKATAKKAARSTRSTATTQFPIADYDTLTVAKIRPQLATLSEAELLEVRAREEQGAARKTILNEIASRLG